MTVVGPFTYQQLLARQQADTDEMRLFHRVWRSQLRIIRCRATVVAYFERLNRAGLVLNLNWRR